MKCKFSLKCDSFIIVDLCQFSCLACIIEKRNLKIMVSQHLIDYFLLFLRFIEVRGRSVFFFNIYIFFCIMYVLCVFRHCCTGNFILAGQETKMLLQGFFFFACDSCGSPVITAAFKCFNRAAVPF